MWTVKFEMDLAAKRVYEMEQQMRKYGYVEPGDNVGFVAAERTRLARNEKNTMYRRAESIEFKLIERRAYDPESEAYAKATKERDVMLAEFLVKAWQIGRYWMLFFGMEEKHDHDLREFYWPPKNKRQDMIPG